MNAIQGAEGTCSEVRLLSRAEGSVGKTSSGSARNLPGDTQGMGAVLSLSRDYVSSALRESGFVDICAGSVATTAELDVRMAGEIAAHFGQQVAASSIDVILDIVSRPDPDYALTLLR